MSCKNNKNDITYMAKFIDKIMQNKTLKNGALFSLFSFANQGASFVLLILLANYIAPVEYGKLSLFNTVVMFLSYLVGFSTQGYISVSYFRKDSSRFREDFFIISVLNIFTCVIFIIITALINTHLNDWIGISSFLIYISIFIVFFQTEYQMLLNYYRIKEEILNYGLLCCIFICLNFVVTLLLVITFDLNWIGRIYAYLFSTLLTGLFSIFYFQNKNLYILCFKWHNIKEIIKWGLPIIPLHISVWLRQGVDRFIINNSYELEDVGLFSFSLNLMSVIVMLGSAFNASNSVSIYKILSSKSTSHSKFSELKKQTSNIRNIYIISCIIISLFIVIFVPILLPKYSQSTTYFMLLAGAGFLQCLYFLYCNYLYYYNKNKQIMYIMIISSLLHLSFSILLTKISLYVLCLIYILSQFFVYYSVKKIALYTLKKELFNEKSITCD